MELMIVWVHRRRNGRVSFRYGQRRVIAQLFVRIVEVDRIKAEAVNTALKPETGHIQKRVTNVFVVEIQIWLAG